MPERHLRRPDVEKITGLSCTTIYRLMNDGAFPRPVRLAGRAVGWPESRIAEWLASREDITAA